MSKEQLSLYLGSFIDELVRSGLKHIVISPGSRSTPLAMLAAEHPQLKVWLQIDERSAGFFALGIAKAKREAVALLCTSGTAAANYMPAITEANLSRVPLIVLTADRPHELRDVGAPQTIDQLDMYGKHVKWFMEMPLPEGSDKMIRHARVMAARAVHTAVLHPAGVVHLNFPLRDPLLPDLQHPQLFASERHAIAPYTSTRRGVTALQEDALLQIMELARSHVKGIIIVGYLEHEKLAPQLVQLAELLQYPILADPLSQLRTGEHISPSILTTYDSFLRDERTGKYLQPTLMLRIGAMPISKPLMLYMNQYPDAEHIVIDEAGWRDPTLLVSHHITASPEVVIEQLLNGLNSTHFTRGEQEWLADWLSISEITNTILQDEVNGEHLGELFEGRVVTELQGLMAEHDVLFVGNSMPIRDVDTFLSLSTKHIKVAANRGANGIDGIVSTAMGMAAVASSHHVTLLIGDLSFYHDLNGLLTSKLNGLDITIVVINNDGGGIFSFLPQASEPKHFEALFGTPLGLDYEHVVRMYEGQFHRIESWEQFQERYKAAKHTGGLQVIELKTNRERNVQLHQSIWPKLSNWLAKYIASRGK